MNSMNQDFKTTELQVLIESQTYTNSMFGITNKGEAVFINNRIAERMNLEEGMTITAHCIPNFEDKRQLIPWRAIRIDPPAGDKPEDIEALLDEVFRKTTGKRQVVDKLVHDLIMECQDFWTTRELADHLGLDTAVVGSSCLRLFNQKKIVMGTIHASPDQVRSSLNLWAQNLSCFKLRQ